MVLGKSYKEVHDELAPKIWWQDTSQPYPSTSEGWADRWKQGINFEEQGCYLDDAYRWLEEHGNATQMKYQYIGGRTPRKEWPPKPWAPVHIASVVTPSGIAHAMVMTWDGKLLDPNPTRSPGKWEECWSFYKSVDHVCGIWKVT